MTEKRPAAIRVRLAGVLRAALALLLCGRLVQAADMQTVQSLAKKIRTIKDAGLVINLSAPSKEVLAASVVLTEMKHALRDWVGSRLVEAEPGVLAARLSSELRNAGLSANYSSQARDQGLIIPECSELGCTLGQIGEVRISNPGPGLLLVRTIVGSWRAFDEPLYLYEHHGSQWVLHVEEDGDSPLIEAQVSERDARRRRLFLVIAHAPVWMNSIHVSYRLYRMGPNGSKAVILLDKLEGGYDRAHARLTNDDLWLEFRWSDRVMSDHYRIGEVGARKIQ